ncbi:MAG: chromate transporter [Oscillospiraceae bacterium]|nr:chromate transporter [Oscillospiraceae bacterium]
MANKNRRLTLFRLFWVFFKAGSFTFAGGLAMLPLIQKDVIDKYEMIDKDTFLDYAALSQTLPGVIALNCGVFVGRKVSGYVGAFVAGFGVILPAFVAMLAATILLNSLPRTDIVESIFAGVRSASAALILYSAITLSSKNYKKLFPILLIAMSFIIVLFFNVSAYWVIIGAALAGLAYRYAKGGKAATAEASGEVKSGGGSGEVKGGGEGPDSGGTK